MTTDDLMPETANFAPPDDLDGAIQRVANASTLAFLAFQVFGGLESFKLAMTECGYNMDVKDLLIGKRIRTYQATILAKDGAKWKMIMNEVGSSWMQIINVLPIAKGDGMSDEDYQQLLELTKVKR